MNVYVTKKIGEKEVALSIEVDENSKNAISAFIQANRLISDFIWDAEPTDQEI